MTVMLKGLFPSVKNEKKSNSNITKYAVGTRVPQNKEAERIVQNAVYNNLNRVNRNI